MKELEWKRLPASGGGPLVLEATIGNAKLTLAEKGSKWEGTLSFADRTSVQIEGRTRDEVESLLIRELEQRTATS